MSEIQGRMVQGNGILVNCKVFAARKWTNDLVYVQDRTKAIERPKGITMNM